MSSSKTFQRFHICVYMCLYIRNQKKWLPWLKKTNKQKYKTNKKKLQLTCAADQSNLTRFYWPQCLYIYFLKISTASQHKLLQLTRTFSLFSVITMRDWLRTSEQSTLMLESKRTREGLPVSITVPEPQIISLPVSYSCLTKDDPFISSWLG